MTEESQLLHQVEKARSAVVAYSGGVDSTVVAVAAWKVFGASGMRAVTGDSPSVARSEIESARTIAAAMGFPWTAAPTDEIHDVRYIANTVSRCYFCKSELYQVLDHLRQEWHFDVIMDGFNQDDTREFRPGARAGIEYRVMSPLKEAGLGKAAVRRLAQKWGLPNWDKPASPCLASRIPYQVPVTPERLQQVEEAEDALHRLGYRNLRVRHHEEVARIEVPVDQMDRLLADREAVVAAVKRAGYQFVTLDLVGLSSGTFARLTMGASLQSMGDRGASDT
ncbi:MAG: ATP-dependent sacrificial sulfur transferase LarE [Firmicutes bacterium]|nr:ATP-dependent sacrificial sulfur transferase LarE [Bacillota bacterium]